ncbi:MAG: hypothetical protein ACK4QP_08325 [Pseudorhizobium sp.]
MSIYVGALGGLTELDPQQRAVGLEGIRSYGRRAKAEQAVGASFSIASPSAANGDGSRARLSWILCLRHAM